MQKGMEKLLSSKRGLSEVVTTLILVLLVIVSILIVWAVVSNILSGNTKKIDPQRFNVQTGIKGAVYDKGADAIIGGADDKIKVTIERYNGPGDLRGMKFVFVTSTGTSEVKEVTLSGATALNEYAEKTFEFGSSSTFPVAPNGNLVMTDISIIKSVTIIPLIGEDK